MQPLRFDIAIVGDNLSARMLAPLLAKHGQRVLLFTTSAPLDRWQNASLFDEKLLGALGGRDHLAGQQPFQVLSSRARVTIRQDIPLMEELRREFGKSGASLGALLGEFEQSGSLLEELFWEHGGLPAGRLRDSCSWHWLCLRSKLSVGRLKQPLAERLASFPGPAGEWLRDLFQGLSLQPLTALSVADGALLWAHARRPAGISPDALNELLKKRLEQFHGVELPFETLSGLEHVQGHWICNLSGGKRFQAGQLILGDLGRKLPGVNPPQPPVHPAPRQFSSSITSGTISALFEKRVIAGGPLPLRLTFAAADSGMTAEGGSCAAADEAGIRHQLEPVFPFARYSLKIQDGPALPENPLRPAAASLFHCPLQLGSHCWCADAAHLLPQLGNDGAALVAWTLARQIDPALAGHGD